MQEIWRDIKGFEGLYQVSNLGRVKSLPHFHKTRHGYYTKEKILSLKCFRAGYPVVSLCKNGKYKSYYIHRLVAETFLENYNNYPVINHKNGNKKDNRVDNIEFCTYLHNNKEALRLGLNNFGAKKVNQYDLNNNFIRQWDSLSLIEKELKIYAINVSKCCRGLLKTAGGYKWRFKDE